MLTFVTFGKMKLYGWFDWFVFKDRPSVLK